jgi:hypothetical protein
MKIDAKKENLNVTKCTIFGKVDEHGQVLIPVTLLAADGFELELDAAVNLQYSGSLLIPELLANSIGWRCIGAARVALGEDIQILSHYLGLVALGEEPKNVMVVGGLTDRVFIGQRLLSRYTLSVDFSQGKVVLTA